MTEKGFINLFEKTLGVFAFGFVLLEVMPVVYIPVLVELPVSHEWIIS